MGQLIDLERQWAFTDPDSTTNARYFGGVLRTGQIIDVINADSTRIAPGTPVKIDAAGSAWPRWDLATTSEPIKSKIGVKNTTAAAELGLVGVALEYILPGQQGRIAGRGTWVAVKCKNPPASNAVGSIVIQDTGTASQVDTVQSGGSYSQTIAHVKGGLALGTVLCPAGAGAGQTGSTTQLGIEVNPF